MKKRTTIAVIIVSVFLIGLLAYAPSFFHTPKSTENNTIMASNNLPVKNLTATPIVTNTPQTNSNSESKVTQPTPSPKPKEVSNTNPVSPKKSISIKINPKPISKPKMPVKKQSVVREKDNLAQGQKEQSQNTPKSSSNTKEQSRWGITIMGTNTGIDGGVSYRILKLSLLNETDLDAIVGIKHAGIGLSKNVYQNLAIGLTGTVTYENGNTNLGIYGKYSF